MVGEGKDGVQTTEMTATDTMPKSYASNTDTSSSTMTRPRLDTPTLNPTPSYTTRKDPVEENSDWRVKIWRKMMKSNRPRSQTRDEVRPREEAYVALPGDADAVSAVYAELNSITGPVHRPMQALVNYPPYNLNTYSEIREPRTGLTAPPSLHLRRLLSDGTYENAAYAVERGMVLLEHDSSSGCASTPSSAYYSDLSNSDRSGLHQHPWNRPRKRNNSESQGSSLSLPHCCHARHDPVRARDLMPVALEVIPDNQQVPIDLSVTGTCCSHSGSFSRGVISASLNTSKRPLPPLPSRQLQRPQRRYAYAIDHAQLSNSTDSQVLPTGIDSPMACVPSEYV